MEGGCPVEGRLPKVGQLLPRERVQRVEDVEEDNTRQYQHQIDAQYALKVYDIEWNRKEKNLRYIKEKRKQ